MPGPWENYSAPASGPWEKYGAAPPASDKQAWTPPAADKQPSSAPDRGFFATLGDDLTGAPKKVMDFITGHPIDDVKQAMRDSYAARQDHLQRADEALKNGDYKEYVDQKFFGSVPFLGPALGASAAEWQAGQKGQAAAHALEILGPALADPAMEGLDSGPATAAIAKVKQAGSVVKAGIKAAAPDIGAGAAMIGAGEVASHIPGMEWPARIALDYPGLRKVVGGLKKGVGAAREAMGPPAPEVPPGFNAAEGSTLNAPAAAPRPAGYQPPVTGALPGTAPPAPPPSVNPLLDQIAQHNGFESFAAAPPEVKPFLENMARNAEPAPRPAMAPAPEPESTAPVDNRSAAQMLHDELEASRAARAPQTPPAVQPEPTQPAPTPQEPVSTPPTPAARTLAQTEAAMAQKKPAPIENTRTRTNADGTPMSPQMRGAVRTAGNVEAKATRWADAFHSEGVTAEDVRNMTAVDLQQMTNGLIAKGKLEMTENAPDTSIPLIISKLKDLEKVGKAPASEVTPSPNGPMSNPKARAAAEALRKAMEEQ